MNVLQEYINNNKNINTAMIAYISILEEIYKVNPEGVKNIIQELDNQRSRIKLIASENYSSFAVHLSMGNLLTDKYSEGYPYHRYYAGCENVDEIEDRASKIACNLFGADYAYLQPHSGADANIVAYWAILDNKILGPTFEQIKDICSTLDKSIKTYDDLNEEEWWYLRHFAHNQKLLSLDYNSGSHLTHGYRQNISAQLFDCYHYSVNEEGYIDYDELEDQAMRIRPLILLAGYSAYPRKLNFKRFREIADKCGAVLMCDMAHFAGLVAGKVFRGEYNPIPYCDIVTTTTHKTLRGPRGGMILCKEWLKDSVNKGCPLVLGGPLPHVMLAKETALIEASQESFKEYANNIVNNCKALANALMENGGILQTGGTDNHLLILRTDHLGLTGRQAETLLLQCGIILNRNAIPNDSNGPWYTSGLRIGTAAVTTLGMGSKEMNEIASIIMKVLKSAKPAIKNGKTSKIQVDIDEDIIEESKKRVKKILDKFVIYPEIDLDFLKKYFIK